MTTRIEGDYNSIIIDITDDGINICQDGGDECFLLTKEMARALAFFLIGATEKSAPSEDQVESVNSALE